MKHVTDQIMELIPEIGYLSEDLLALSNILRDDYNISENDWAKYRVICEKWWALEDWFPIRMESHDNLLLFEDDHEKLFRYQQFQNDLDKTYSGVLESMRKKATTWGFDDYRIINRIRNIISRIVMLLDKITHVIQEYDKYIINCGNEKE